MTLQAVDNDNTVIDFTMRCKSNDGANWSIDMRGSEAYNIAHHLPMIILGLHRVATEQHPNHPLACACLVVFENGDVLYDGEDVWNVNREPWLKRVLNIFIDTFRPKKSSE